MQSMLAAETRTVGYAALLQHYEEHGGTLYKVYMLGNDTEMQARFFLFLFVLCPLFCFQVLGAHHARVLVKPSVSLCSVGTSSNAATRPPPASNLSTRSPRALLGLPVFCAITSRARLLCCRRNLCSGAVQRAGAPLAGGHPRALGTGR
jgi:hypothetical protein